MLYITQCMINSYTINLISNAGKCINSNLLPYLVPYLIRKEVGLPNYSDTFGNV